ncbi:MAG: hypothetical protein ABR555_20040 [Pyrinomonadaceae bacterium]
MATQNKMLKQNEAANSDQNDRPEKTGKTRKQFVEPELSTPVDVLEATTFQPATSSGVTN